MSAAFCSACGKSREKSDIFCAFCGNKLEAEKQSQIKDTVKTLSQYEQSKASERTSHFKSNKVSKEIKPAVVKKKTESVVINVGVTRDTDKGMLSNVCGSKLPLKVSRDWNAANVLVAAREKHSAHDQFFCGEENYVLLYPDHKLVETIPGKDELFTVEKYKKELTKPFSKIDLYLCKEYDYNSFIDGSLGLIERKMTNFSHIPKTRDDNDLFSDFDVNNFFSPDEILLNSDCTEPAEKLVKSEPVQERIDNYFLSPSASSASSSSATLQHGRCPLCNKKFPFSILNEHANACLKKQETPLICIEDLEDINDTYYTCENDTHSQEIEALSSSDFQKKLANVIKTCTMEQVGTELPIQLNVRRKFEFTDFVKFFSKSWNKKKIYFPYRVNYIGEAGIDTGGISREFYTEALKEIKDLYFIGDDINGYEPSCGLLSVADGTVKSIGHLIAASICNGGPAPNFFSLWIYKFIVGGIHVAIKDCPIEIEQTSQHSAIFNKLSSTISDKDVSELFTTDAGMDVLEVIGYRGVPEKGGLKDKDGVLESIIIKLKIEPLLPVINEIIAGLNVYGVYEVIKKNYHIMQAVFCRSSVFQWDHNSFVSSLKPSFSLDGGNRKSHEVTTYKAFMDFIEYCFNDENADPSPNEVIQFITGSPSIPVLGLPNDITVTFLHECKTSLAGTACNCLPTVSTCEIQLCLPVHIDSENCIIDAFRLEISCESGFGRC